MYVRDLPDQIQLDLVDMGKFKNKNQGIYWILTAVAVLSRYALAIPVYRKDTKNMTEAVNNLLGQLRLGHSLVSSQTSHSSMMVKNFTT